MPIDQCKRQSYPRRLVYPRRPNNRELKESIWTWWYLDQAILQPGAAAAAAGFFLLISCARTRFFVSRRETPQRNQ